MRCHHMKPFFLPNGIFFLFVLFLSVKQQLSSSCCFVRSTTAVIFFVLFCPCNRYLFLFSTHGVPQAIHCSSLSFPFRSSCITFFRTSVVRFASLSVLLSFFLFSFSLFFLFFSWSGLIRCALVPGALALQSFYLDELRLFGLLWLTVCDHRICISLLLLLSHNQVSMIG